MNNQLRLVFVFFAIAYLSYLFGMDRECFDSFLCLPVDWKNQPPLLYACLQKKPNITVIKKLLEYGACPNVQDWSRRGFTPLSLLCRNVYFLLLKQPVSQEQLDSLKAIIKKLLYLGADPNLSDYYRWLPAHHLCSIPEGNADLIFEFLSLFIKHGADLTLINSDEETPLDLLANKDERESLRKQLNLV
jgi:ankyrin repeat protein